MKSVWLGAFAGLVLTGQAMASCNYNFDATQAQLTMAELGDKFPSLTNQQGSFNIQGNNPTGTTTYAAASSAFISSGGLSDKSLPSSGIVAFELNTKLINTDMVNQEKVTVTHSVIATDSAGRNFVIQAGYGNNTAVANYEKYLIVWVFDFRKNPNSNNLDDIIVYRTVEPIDTSKAVQNLGFYLNQSTNQLGVIINGTNKGYVASLTEKASGLAILMKGEQSFIATNSNEIGKTVSAALVTDGASLSQAYPSGSKDICGTTL